MLISLDSFYSRKENEQKVLEQKISQYKEIIQNLRVGFYKEIIQVEGYTHKLEAEIEQLKGKQDFDLLISPDKKNSDPDAGMKKVHFFDGTEGLDMN